MRHLFFLIPILFLVCIVSLIPSASALTYSSNNPSVDGYVSGVVEAAVQCNPTSFSIDTASGSFYAATPDGGIGSNCNRAFAEYNITSIPDSVVITSVHFLFDNSIYINAQNCDFIGMAFQPTIATTEQIYDDIASDVTILADNNAVCFTTGTSRDIDLGSAGVAYIQNHLASNWASIGIRSAIDPTRAVGITSGAAMCAEEGACTTKPTLTITYGYFFLNTVTDLHSTDIRGTGVDLAWSAPSTNGTIIGYQINDTIPWNTPLTIIQPNSGSTLTTATISPLTGNTNYSFRVSGLLQGGVFKNVTGNILNITTDVDVTKAFTPGTFDLNASGVDIRTFKFSRNDTSTSTILSVQYPNTFNATCNFYYKFAMTNNTYTNLADVPVNTAEDKATFTFNGLNNDIIDVNCFDTPTNKTGRYLIQQTHFPFQDQIANFRNGTYGTHGDFGSFDFITIIAVLLSFIGFNRVNAVVGVVFCAITISVLAAFGFIAWYTPLTTAFAIFIFWVWSTHRKDD